MNTKLVVCILFFIFVTVYSIACQKHGDVLEIDEESVLEAEMMRFRRRPAFASTIRRAIHRPTFHKKLGAFGKKLGQGLKKTFQAGKKFGAFGNKIGQGVKKGLAAGRKLFRRRVVGAVGAVGKIVKTVIGGGVASNFVGNIANEAQSRGVGSGGFDQWLATTKSGKVAISSQRAGIGKSLCLHEVFYCYIDCPSQFGMKCSVSDAQIYSIQIARKEHEQKCVAPRVAAGQKKEDCYFSPCPCSQYENYFYETVGKEEYTESFSLVQNQCQSWCTTGVQPKGVMNEAQFTKKMSKIKKAWKKFKKFFKKIGKKLKAVGKKIGRFFRRVFRRR